MPETDGTSRNVSNITRYQTRLQGGSYHSASSDSVSGLRLGLFSVTLSNLVSASWIDRGKLAFGVFFLHLGSRQHK